MSVSMAPPSPHTACLESFPSPHPTPGRTGPFTFLKPPPSRVPTCLPDLLTPSHRVSMAFQEKGETPEMLGHRSVLGRVCGKAMGSGGGEVPRCCCSRLDGPCRGEMVNGDMRVLWVWPKERKGKVGWAGPPSPLHLQG